jgi:thiol-disulfide isomerase/thioredoxin
LVGNLNGTTRKHHFGLFFMALLSIMVVLSFGGCEGKAKVEQSATPKIGTKVGFTAPSFSVKTLSGNEVNLKDELGRPVFINFFATWCHFCRAEMPYIEALYKELGEQVAFMIIDIGEGKNTVESYFESQGLTVPVYLDPLGVVASSYAVRGIPASFFVDAQGVIRDVVIGAMTEKRLQQGMDAILP